MDASLIIYTSPLPTATQSEWVIVCFKLIPVPQATEQCSVGPSFHFNLIAIFHLKTQPLYISSIPTDEEVGLLWVKLVVEMQGILESSWPTSNPNVTCYTVLQVTLNTTSGKNIQKNMCILAKTASCSLKSWFSSFLCPRLTARLQWPALLAVSCGHSIELQPLDSGQSDGYHVWAWPIKTSHAHYPMLSSFTYPQWRQHLCKVGSYDLKLAEKFSANSPSECRQCRNWVILLRSKKAELLNPSTLIHMQELLCLNHYPLWYLFIMVGSLP